MLHSNDPVRSPVPPVFFVFPLRVSLDSVAWLTRISPRGRELSRHLWNWVAWLDSLRPHIFHYNQNSNGGVERPERHLRGKFRLLYSYHDRWSGHGTHVWHYVCRKSGVSVLVVDRPVFRTLASPGRRWASLTITKPRMEEDGITRTDRTRCHSQRIDGRCLTQ